jgi:hypothetical protein
MGRGPHLEPEDDADGAVARQRPGPLEEADNDRNGELGPRNRQGRTIQPERPEQLLLRDSGPYDEVRKVQRVCRRQRERFVVYRHRGPN